MNADVAYAVLPLILVVVLLADLGQAPSRLIPVGIVHVVVGDMDVRSDGSAAFEVEEVDEEVHRLAALPLETVRHPVVVVFDVGNVVDVIPVRWLGQSWRGRCEETERDDVDWEGRQLVVELVGDYQRIVAADSQLPVVVAAAVAAPPASAVAAEPAASAVVAAAVGPAQRPAVTTWRRRSDSS